MPRIVIRTTEQEHERVHELARAEGLTISAFVRQRIGIDRATHPPPREPRPKTENFEYERLVKQFIARGNTAPLARALAKQQLGL